MNTAANWWTTLQDRHLSRPPSNVHSYSVKHSIGRGQFRDMAKEMVVPEVVLDKIIKNYSSFWTETPCVTGRRSLPAELRVGGAGLANAAYSRQMKGVRVEGREVQCKPKKSGRARALHLRTNQYLQLQPRKPGSLASRSHDGRSLSEAADSEREWLAQQQVCTRDHYLERGSLASVSQTSLTSRASSLSVSSSSLESGPGGATGPELSGNCYGTSVLGTTRGLDVVAHPFRSSLSPSSLQRSVSPDVKSASTRYSVKATRQREGESSYLEEEEEMVNAGAAGNSGLGWCIDQNTLLLSHLPSTVTEEDIIQSIEAFGTVSNCSIMKTCHTRGSEEGTGIPPTATSAYVRMAEESACISVLSHFHNNSYENSEEVNCTYPLLDRH